MLEDSPDDTWLRDQRDGPPAGAAGVAAQDVQGEHAAHQLGSGVPGSAGLGREAFSGGARRGRAGGGCVVVLGYPGFYSRFGFQVASSLGIQCQYDVPDPVLMVAELAEGALGSISGLARYQPEFEGF